MAIHTHNYKLSVQWTGNTGQGTTGYKEYLRDHTVQSGEKPLILCSSDPAFRGDASRYNPEELFVASISYCHMLWYLHLCAENGIVVVDYKDNAVGTMEESPDGSGKFTEVFLQPEVLITDESKRDLAWSLHERAHKYCFIANSCNFPIEADPLLVWVISLSFS